MDEILVNFALEFLGDISGIDSKPPTQGIQRRKRSVGKKIAASVVSESKINSMRTLLITVLCTEGLSWVNILFILGKYSNYYYYYYYYCDDDDDKGDIVIANFLDIF